MIMKKYIPLITGILFVLAASLILFNTRSPLLFPTTDVAIHNDADLGPVYMNYLFIQEIDASAEYLNGVELVLGNLEAQNTNENVVLLLDRQFNVLQRFRLPGKEVGQVKHYPFFLDKPAFVGKGNKIYICLYSTDGAGGNNIALARKASADVGKIYVAPLLQNDVFHTLRAMQGNVFGGSFAMKLYESDTALFYGLRPWLFLLILFTGLFIVFFRQIRSVLFRYVVRPEWIFGIIGLTSGVTMVFVTPPLQVPDEIVHFYGSFRVSEGNMFDFDYDIPVSLKEFTEPFGRMKFKPVEKITMEEINVHASVPLDPDHRVTEYTGNFTFPYVFQALGISLGRAMDFSPLNLMYAGRLSNLILSLTLLFLAIRITPVLKWLFFLLGLMPMMVNQMASLSYDGITYGMTFLFLAMVFRLAFEAERSIRNRDLVWLFVVALVLGLCKPPYMMVVLTFLIIPVKRIGSWWKPGAVMAGLLIVTGLASQHMRLRTFFVAEESAVTAEADKPVAAADTIRDLSPNPVNRLNPTLQLDFMKKNPGQYPAIVGNTLVLAWDIYTSCFVGLLGWVDTPLPEWLTFGYLFLLLFTALFIAERAIRIRPLVKAWLMLLFLLGFLLVMTAMYIYANVPGSKIIHAVQGRYFIPLAPLFFIVFYNIVINRKMNGWTSRLQGQKGKDSRKGKALREPAAEVIPDLFNRLFQILIVVSVVISLAVTFYTILSRYYIITG